MLSILFGSLLSMGVNFIVADLDIYFNTLKKMCWKGWHSLENYCTTVGRTTTSSMRGNIDQHDVDDLMIAVEMADYGTLPSLVFYMIYMFDV